MITEKLINSKWDAIDSATSTINAVRNDLFDNVALALSRVEGRLQFLNSPDLDDEPRINGEHCQKVAKEIQQEVNETRKALDAIFVQLTEGKNSLFN
tara:strand:- start:215 stop:505 length:291 start_codon:yes stop_codon:yes gene_type:complete